MSKSSDNVTDAAKIADRWRKDAVEKAKHHAVKRTLEMCADEIDPPAPKPDVAEQAFENVIKQKPLDKWSVLSSAAIAVAREAVRLRDEQCAKAEAGPTMDYCETHAPAESLVDRVVREQAGRWTLVSWERPLEDFGRDCIRALAEKLDAEEINKEFQADGNYMRFSTVVEWTVAYFKQLAGAKPAEQEGAET